MPNGKCAHHGPLSSAQRKRLRPSDFALPKERKYPIPDVSHARNAKARASQQLERGKLSRAEYNRIVRKADTVIKACGGNPNDNPHGMWSSNPGTGWWILGAVVGVGAVGGGGYLLYRHLKKAPPLPGPSNGKIPKPPAPPLPGPSNGKIPKPPIPVEDDEQPPGLQMPDEDEAEPVAGAEGPDVGPVLAPVVARHGSQANPNTNEVLISSRAQWLAFAKDFLRKRGFADLDAAELIETWSRAYPPSVGVGPGWRVAGRTWTDLQLQADRWLDDVRGGTYVVPVGFDMFEAAALVTLGETPPEWAIFVGDVRREDLYTAARIGAKDHTVAVRFVEQQLPDQTERFWEWLAWGPDVYQLNENNAMQVGRGSSRQDAVNKAREYVRTYPLAIAVAVPMG